MTVTRWLCCASVLALGTCTIPPKTHASVEVATPTATSGERAPESPSAALPSNAEPGPQVVQDVALIVGGSLAPVHVSQRRIDEIVARSRTRPDAYADEVRRAHRRFEDNSGTVHRFLNSSHAPEFLARLYSVAPRKIEEVAAQLLPLYEMVPAQPIDPDDLGWAARRGARLALMRALAGGIDRPREADWSTIGADQVCLTAAAGKLGLTAVLTCTCGNRLSCTAIRSKNRIAVDLRMDQNSSWCRDCYASWTTCTVDAWQRDQAVDIAVNGQRLGRLEPGANGTIALGACVPSN